MFVHSPLKWMISFCCLSLAGMVVDAQLLATWTSGEALGDVPYPAAYNLLVPISNGSFVFIAGNNDDPNLGPTWNTQPGLTIMDTFENSNKVRFKTYRFRDEPCDRSLSGVTFHSGTQQLYLYGGWTRKYLLNDLWSFNFKKMEWTMHWNWTVNQPSTLPRAAREPFLTEYNATHLLLLGGNSLRTTNNWYLSPGWSLNDLTYLIDISNPKVVSWTTLALPNYLDFNMQTVSHLRIGHIIYRFGGCSLRSTCGRTTVQPYFAWAKVDLSKSTLKWEGQKSNSENLTDINFWPSERNGQSCAVVGKQIWCLGGRFFDSEKPAIFYDDVKVFDTTIDKWVEVFADGRVQAPLQLAATASVDNKIFAISGETPDGFTNAVNILLPGVILKKENMYAYGSGVNAATVSQTSSFQISVREWRGGDSSLIQPGKMLDVSMFGETIGWASSLRFDVLLTKVAPIYGNAETKRATVTPVGDGLYNVSYTIERGSQYEMSVKYLDQNIPGSPFLVRLNPGPVSFRSVFTGFGVTSGKTMKNKISRFLIQGVDDFENMINVPRVTDRTLISVSVKETSTQKPAENVEIVANKDGTFTVSYLTPSSTYRISCLIAGKMAFETSMVPTDAEEIAPALMTAVTVIVALGLASVVACGVGLGYYWNTTVIKASSPRLLVLMILGSVLGLITVLFLGRTDDSSCRTMQFLGGISFVLIFGTFLAINYRIHQIFSSTSLRVVRISDERLMVLAVSFCIIEALINIIWISVDPLHESEILLSTSDFITYKSCDSDHLQTWYILFIGYKALLLIYIAYLATKVRNVPSTFNEAKTLALVVYNFTLSCLIAVPLVLLLNERRSAQYMISAIVMVYLMVFTPVVTLSHKFVHRNQSTDASTASKSTAAASKTGAAASSVVSVVSTVSTYSAASAVQSD